MPKRKNSQEPVEGEASKTEPPTLTQPTIGGAELERLLSLTSTDPHASLGAHPTPSGVIVRALRPDAVKVELLIADDAPREMFKTHPA